MDFFQWFFVPFVTLMLILGSVWGLFQLQAKSRKSQGSDNHDQESVKEMLIALEKLEAQVDELSQLIKEKLLGKEVVL